MFWLTHLSKAWTLLNKPFICVLIGTGLFTGLYQYQNHELATRQWLMSNSKYLVESSQRIDHLKNLFPLESFSIAFEDGRGVVRGKPAPEDLIVLIEGGWYFFSEFNGTKTDALLYEVGNRFPELRQSASQIRDDMKYISSLALDRTNYIKVDTPPEYINRVLGSQLFKLTLKAEAQSEVSKVNGHLGDFSRRLRQVYEEKVPGR